MKRQEKIQKILEKVKGTKNIPSIKSVKRRILIPKIRNKDGEAEKTRQGIANVFAKFHEELYKGEDEQDDESKHAHIDQENADSSQNETIPEFTKEEIQAAIHHLKKGRAKDNSGVRAVENAEQKEEGAKSSSKQWKHSATRGQKSGSSKRRRPQHRNCWEQGCRQPQRSRRIATTKTHEGHSSRADFGLQEQHEPWLMKQPAEYKKMAKEPEHWTT